MTSTLTTKRIFFVFMIFLIISLGLANYFKSVLAFLPCLLLISVTGVIQLKRKGDLLFLAVFTTLVISAIIILLTSGNVLDIPFLKRMTG